jgi:glycosyltransferase involved in cell wall biosynthesis
MRILITTGIFPPDIGGPATYVPQIATALADRGHAITVITLSDSRRPLSSPKGDGERVSGKYPFPVVRLSRQTFKPWRWLLTVLTIIRLGRSADVLFVNGLALEAVLVNFLLRKPLVQKVVGDLAWEWAANRGWVKDQFEDFQKRRYDTKVEALKTLRAWWTRQANRVIVPSHYLARWVTQCGVPEEEISVVYNAVEPADSIQPCHLPLAACLKLKVVTVGRLVSWKQVDQIIQAIAQCDRVGLVIIGDGPEQRRLEELVRTWDLADRVYFAGRRSKAEALSLMAACDLMVLNSTYEGFPHVVLEAMSLGLPVIARDVGGTSEVIQNGENGLLMAPTANGVLSKTLSQLISFPVERQRLAKGARHTIERFRLAAVVEATENVLRNSVSLRGM